MFTGGHESSRDYTSFIYGLVDPFSGQLHYVGCSRDPIYRLSCHVSSAIHEGHVSKKNSWLISLREKNIKPEIITLQEVDDIEKSDHEMFWIEYFKMIGANLFNIIGVIKRYQSKTQVVVTDTFNSTMVYPLRVKLGLSQEEFGWELGCSMSCVSRWESGSRPNMGLKYIKKINRLIKKHKRHMEA